MIFFRLTQGDISPILFRAITRPGEHKEAAPGRDVKAISLDL